MKKKLTAEEAIKAIAVRDGVTVEEVRKQIKLAMLAGLCHQDPAVQARWKKIPCKGELPTPEEFITYCAACVDAGVDPFA